FPIKSSSRSQRPSRGSAFWAYRVPPASISRATIKTRVFFFKGSMVRTVLTRTKVKKYIYPIKGNFFLFTSPGKALGVEFGLYRSLQGSRGQLDHQIAFPTAVPFGGTVLKEIKTVGLLGDPLGNLVEGVLQFRFVGGKDAGGLSDLGQNPGIDLGPQANGVIGNVPVGFLDGLDGIGFPVTGSLVGPIGKEHDGSGLYGFSVRLQEFFGLFGGFDHCSVEIGGHIGADIRC